MFDLGRIGGELAEVLAARQRNAAFRTLVPVLVAGASVTCFSGVSVARLWVWAVVYVAGQALEVRRNRALLARPTAVTGPQAAATLAGFAALGLVYAAGCLVVLASGARFSPMLTVLMLTGALLNNIVASRRSAQAFVALNGPHVLVLVFLPLAAVAKGLTPPIVWAVALGGALVSVSAVLAWRAQAAALSAHADAQALLARRHAEAEASVTARAAFTAAVSHELRTPLSAVAAAAAVLESRAVTTQSRETAAMITEAARHMRRLLDDLLDFAKLEAGRMSVEVAPFDLRVLLAETGRLWTVEAGAKGLDLAVEGVDALPGRVEGDATRLRQVLNNLLSNALKFTAQGEVRIDASAAWDRSGAWRVRLAVSDTGPGLDAQALERMFQPFEQGGAATAAVHGGTGLGLAISRELARLMGGGLTAAQREDRPGARFVLEIPLRAAAPDVAAPAEVRREAACVLVVDDHPLGRQAARVLLGLRGHEVRLCEGGEAALAILAEVRVDLVLTDLTMQDMDGFELARRVRRSVGPNRDVPIVALSGAAGADQACFAAGMDGFVIKPLEPRLLYAAVDAALASRCNAAASLAESAASSFSSHSQTVSTFQPPVASAA